MDNMVKLYVVVPCYNEEPVLDETSRQMKELFGKMESDGLISPDSRIVFVDDGSRIRRGILLTVLLSRARCLPELSLRIMQAIRTRCSADL